MNVNSNMASCDNFVLPKINNLPYAPVVRVLWEGRVKGVKRWASPRMLHELPTTANNQSELH
jgi:hypothetical protein